MSTAILDALGDNATHGVRRSNADKRKAVMTLLEDDEWSKWSDQEIARRAHVDHVTVGRVRKSLVKCTSDAVILGGHMQDTAEELAKVRGRTRTYTTKHGATATMQGKRTVENAEALFEGPRP